MPHGAGMAGTAASVCVYKPSALAHRATRDSARSPAPSRAPRQPRRPLAACSRRAHQRGVEGRCDHGRRRYAGADAQRAAGGEPVGLSRPLGPRSAGGFRFHPPRPLLRADPARAGRGAGSAGAGKRRRCAGNAPACCRSADRRVPRPRMVRARRGVERGAIARTPALAVGAGAAAAYRQAGTRRALAVRQAARMGGSGRAPCPASGRTRGACGGGTAGAADG